MGRVVKVAKLPTDDSKLTWEELAALICWYYPAYTFAKARKLPHKRQMLFLKVARQQEARRYFNLVQIAAAPHTSKGEGVARLAAQFEEIMNE